MTNEIIIRDSTLNELTRIQNVINPIVSEQINAHYTFTFDTVVDENMQYLNNNNIIEIEDNYFRVARVVKSRSTSVNVTVECEHISYDLLDNDEYPMPFEEYEGNVEFMAHELLNGTPFSIGKFEGAGYYFIKPNSDNIRGTLIELANLIGCELEYDKFTINFLNRRGVVSNQKFKLGENLIGVTEEIDYTGGYPRKALEVDVVDLSQVPGYEYLLTIGLGDTVTTIEPILNINETLRIVSKEYNPFQKINPRVQIGNVLRDITDYLKEEDETPTDLGLKEFKIGDVDCLSLSGVEITESYRKYLEDGTPFEVTATVEYPTEGLTGLFVERSNNFFGIRVKEINNGITTDYFYKDLDSLKTRKYPSTEDTVVLVIISYVSIDYLTANDEFKVYAVKFGQGEPDTDNYWLSEFRIGDVNCLSLTGLQMQSADDEPTAIVEYEENYQYEGLFVSLKEEYQDYTCEFILYYDDGDIWQETIENGYFDIDLPQEGSTWKTTHLVIKVTNPDNTEHQYFGVKFVEKEPDQSGGGDETLLIYNPNSALDILNNETQMLVGSIEIQDGNSFIGNFSGDLLISYADADISLINPYLVINLVAVNYETGNIKRMCRYENLHTVRPLKLSKKSYVAINFQKSFAFNGFESNKWELEVIVGIIEGDIKYELLEELILIDVEVWLKGKGIKKIEEVVAE